MQAADVDVNRVITSPEDHVWINRLKEQLRDGKIDRRDFLRYSTLLGLSSGAAYMWAADITGQPIAEPAFAQTMLIGGTLRIAQRVPKIDSSHAFSWG